MKLPIFHIHDWSRWHSTYSAGEGESVMMKICLKCGRIRGSDWSDIKYIPQAELKKLEEIYFKSNA